MRQNILLGATLSIFILTFLPNVSAFFGSSAAPKAYRLSTNHIENALASTRRNIGDRRSSSLSALPTLLADPMPNSIGNFFENKTDGMSFIQCYMLSVAVVGGQQYGTA